MLPTMSIRRCVIPSSHHTGEVKAIIGEPGAGSRSGQVAVGRCSDGRSSG